MGVSLDRSQPYGEIYPAGYAAYEQNGKLFDRSGNEVTERVEPVAVAPETPDLPRHIDLRKKENRHLRRMLPA